MKKNPGKPGRVAPCKPDKRRPLPSKPKRAIPDNPRPGPKPKAPLPPFPTPEGNKAAKKTLVGMCVKKRGVGGKDLGGRKTWNRISRPW